jgi:protein-disulfide isomerase
MQLSRTTLFIIAGAALMVASVFLALQLASNRSDEATPAFATSKADIERIVHSYLMEHPEVIFDAVKQMETKENDDRMSQMRDGAKTHAAQLFHEPGAITVGNPNGDVTIVEFFDYHCTYCRKVVGDLTSLVKQDGNIKLILKDFPILSKESEVAARAAIASYSQGKYWDFHLALMAAEDLSEESILVIAKNVGLNVAQLKVDMAKSDVKDAIARTNSLARDLGIEATPTFYVGDTPFSGALPLSDLKDAVAKARKASKGA